jgi:hypothetical protein
MGTGREGSLQYSDGRHVINGNIDYANPPVPLDTMNYYFLAVWAWDNNGIKVQYSSPQTYFAIR